MSGLSATYVLDPDQSEPVKFNYQTDKYHVCPDCARAHELRTCNGEITITFEFCENHLDAPKNPCFDQVLLDEIREDIHTLYPFDSSLDTTSAECKPILLYADYSYVSKWDKTKPAEPVIFYAHTKGCSRSESPEVLIISANAIALMDDIATKRLHNIITILDANIQTSEHPKLLGERTRLESCLSACKTAKGMYMKRCNGEYRNSLDDEIIPDPTEPNGYRPSDMGYAMLDMEGPCEKKRWTYGDNGWPNPIPTTFTYKKLKIELGKVAEGKATEHDFLVTVWYSTRSGKRSEAWLKERLELQRKSKSRG
ncbi:hypothetical protein LTR84_011563 [Exophiala bonariae]|uniref:Uncharacterized protein n=1 Tax=Exophiala bonariae TaxID=1690606 RepID=A0AAV9NK01_9EURO|nr:hypothetical protein LTR84_011563 [Exophiala bonariae]